MGRRGPIPEPVGLKLIRGNPGKRPLKERPQPGPSKVACPAWLSTPAKAEWKRVAPELQKMGLLTQLDIAALAGYCQNYADWVEATRFIHEHGEHYLTPKGQLRQWPQAETARKAEAAMRAFASEFGLTPNSRARLSVEAPKDKRDDPFEKFLSRAR